MLDVQNVHKSIQRKTLAFNIENMQCNKHQLIEYCSIPYYRFCLLFLK